MLKWRDRVMQVSLIFFLVLLCLVWSGNRSDIIKYLFYVPIIGSLTYATQVFMEEKSFAGRLSGNLVGIVICIISVLFAIRFPH
jgi:hypothetical protein